MNKIKLALGAVVTAINETKAEMADAFAKLQEQGLLVKEYEPSYVAPWEMVDNTKDGTRRTYCVKNLKDAIREVLPTRITQAMTINELHAAITEAGMTYALNSVRMTLSGCNMEGIVNGKLRYGGLGRPQYTFYRKG